jgi:hypothetical protein
MSLASILIELCVGVESVYMHVNLRMYFASLLSLLCVGGLAACKRPSVLTSVCFCVYIYAHTYVCKYELTLSK